MDSKLKDEIVKTLAVQGVTDGYICDKTKAIADSILSLLAPELEKARKLDLILSTKAYTLFVDATEKEFAELKEKARKWDRVMHFAERGNEECDKTCPYYSEKHVDECSIFGSCPFCNVVDALSKEAP